MKKLAFKNIKTRLTFWFLFISLVPLLLTLLITYNQRVKAIETQTFDKLTAIRDLKVESLNEWLIERLGDMRTIAGTYDIRKLEYMFDNKLNSPESSKFLNEAGKLLNRYLENFPSYSEIFIIDSITGLVELSTDSGSVGSKKSENPYFKIPMETGEIYIKDIYYSNSTGRPEMTFSLPIICKAHNKHIIGVLVARVDLENSLFKMLFDRVGLGETGETLIVNKDVVALNELRWYDNAPLNLQINAEPAVNAANGKTGIAVTTDYRGEKILAAYTYIPETGWGFVCKQDLYELNSPIRRMIVDFIILFITSVILIYLIAFIIGNNISKPIIGMANISRKIKSGDLSIRNPVRSGDELGSLAESINEMAVSIGSRINIQQEVTDISDLMVGISSMQEFGSGLLGQLVKTTKANMGVFYILNEITSEYEHFVSVGANKELLRSFSAVEPEGEFGNPVKNKKISYLHDIPENTIFKFQTTTGNIIPRDIITIPVLSEDTVIALISLVSIHKFDKNIYDILEQSWININTSYSNILGNERTRVLADSLSKTNQQLEAQTEELQAQSEELQSQSAELQQTAAELQEQNLELDMQKREVEEANKMKSQFLSNMSHELRTPLNSIMALSRALILQAGNKLNDEENNYLEIVERNGKLLLSLINDILDLSKIEAGKIDLIPELMSIGDLLKRSKENLEPLLSEKDLIIDISIPEGMPDVETDREKLFQVLLNVIGNSIKFTEKGKVDIRASYDAEYVYMEIEDTGIGISRDEIPKIFDEFRQVDGTSKRQFEGTGLGLAISLKIMKLLNGAISVKSEIGKGSTFTITLPIKWRGSESDIKTQPDIDINSASTIKIPESSKGSRDISDTRILIVEDNQTAVFQIRSMLESEGYMVDAASNGLEALKYIKDTIPDGIIMDLMMPGMDGFEVLDNIRSRESTGQLPVLILTAKDLNKKDLSRLNANNIHQLIQKGDVDRDELLSKLKLMLNI